MWFLGCVISRFGWCHWFLWSIISRLFRHIIHRFRFGLWWGLVTRFGCRFLLGWWRRFVHRFVGFLIFHLFGSLIRSGWLGRVHHMNEQN